MSIELYEQIGSNSECGSTVIDDRYVKMLAEWIDDAVIICDGKLTVTLINRVAQGMTGKSADEIENRQLSVAFPEIKGSLLENYVRRSVVSRTLNSAELPSPFVSDRWISFQSFPLGDNIVFKFRDITDDMQTNRLANVKEALIQAFELNGHIGYVRLSARGTIDRLDDRFAAMIGIPIDRLSGLSLADLIDLPQRAEFRATIERVLRDHVPLRAETGFLTNDGQVKRMNVAMVPLVGSYGCEGIVAILTKDDSSEL